MTVFYEARHDPTTPSDAGRSASIENDDMDDGRPGR